ncbi:hypothetical protein [Sporolactobacillus terrae]|uniref:hypothetical protein n=1 Tax=Sporolactobacillus terrae TaxID=269673 RepID=UPI001119306A|nr:hypothetical protein [Sporolactobacillus terrae]
MQETVVFGGLSPAGFSLSEALLNAGNQVLSISSAVSKKEKEKEENNELYLGRNALFHHVHEAFDQCEGKPLIFADTFRIDPKYNRALQEKLTLFLKTVQPFKRLIFISSIEPVQEQNDYSKLQPVAGSKAADDTEAFFIQVLKEIGQNDALIFRTDLNELMATKGIESAAGLFLGLIEAKHDGLDVVAYSSKAGADAPVNSGMRHLLPPSYHKLL